MSGWTPADLLPAVWLLVLAVAIDRSARRWAAPIPAAAWAVAGAIVLALFAPSLLLGRVQASLGLLTGLPPLHQLRDVAGPANPLHGDVLFQIIPLQAVVRRLLEAGEWPLWNAWTGAGAPLLANAQAQVLQPLVWLAGTLPLPASLGVVAALRVVVALASAFLLLRYQGAGRYPALFGAAAYALSGFLILYLGWPLANSAALLPLAVYATVRWMAERDRRSFVLLAVALAAVLAAGHPDTVLWVLIAAGAFVVSRLPLGRRRGARPERAGPERSPGLPGFARGAAGWVLAVAAAAALTAPVNLPAALQVPHSQRYAMTESREQRLEAEIRRPGRWEAGELWQELATSGRRLLAVAAPNAFGNQRFGPFWGEGRTVNDGSGGFAGSATLLGCALALVGLLARRGPGIAGERTAAALGALAALLFAELPGVNALLVQVPGLDHSAGFHRRSAMVLAFALAYLGAAAVERWRRGALRPGAVVAAAAGLAALVVWGYLAHPFPRSPETLSRLRHGSLALHLGVLAVACALLASRRLGRSRWAVLALMVVQGAELVSLHGPANPTAPPIAFYPPTQALEHLREAVDGGRMTGVGRLLPANAPSVYGLADVRTSDPSKPWEVQRLLEPVFPPDRRRGIGEMVAVADHPVLDLLGVGHMLAPLEQPAPSPLRRVFADRTSAVWERPRPLPRLFLPESAVALSPGSGEGTDADRRPWAWIARNPDFAARSLVEPSPSRPDRWRAARPAGAVLDVELGSATRWRARALLPEERLLATGIYQDGGWRVLADGRPVPAVRTNGPLVGAWLPAGEHRLDLVYRPPGFLAGCLLAALALAALAAVSVRPPAGSAIRPDREAARLDACA